MGNIINTAEDFLNTMGDVQYCGGYYDKCGGGEILSTMGGVQDRGGFS